MFTLYFDSKEICKSDSSFIFQLQSRAGKTSLFSVLGFHFPKNVGRASAGSHVSEWYQVCETQNGLSDPVISFKHCALLSPGEY